MAKKLADDEMPMKVSGAADIPEATAKAIAQQAAKVAPSMADVMAYWTPGREITMEVPQLIAEYSVPCVMCGVMLPYIPVAGQDAPTLICAEH